MRRSERASLLSDIRHLVLAAVACVNLSAMSAGFDRAVLPQSSSSDTRNSSPVGAVATYCASVPSLPASVAKDAAASCGSLASGLKTLAESDAVAFRSLLDRADPPLTGDTAVRKREFGEVGMLWLKGMNAGLAALVGVFLWRAGKHRTLFDLIKEKKADGVGQLSFSRFVGLIGGTCSLVWIILMFNTAMAYFFQFGQVPDQWASFLMPFGTLLTSMVPYTVNQLSPK